MSARRARVTRNGLDAEKVFSRPNPVARDSRPALAVAVACKTQNNNACSAGYGDFYSPGFAPGVLQISSDGDDRMGVN